MLDLSVLATGVIEQIGAQSLHKYCLAGHSGKVLKVVTDHQQGLSSIIELLKKSKLLINVADLSAIGHRVVHGGESFHQPTLIDEQVLASIRKMIPLAPLHNPANLMGIELMLQLADNVPQVAVFDTAYHQTIPEHAFLYALPLELYEQASIRRYGFHGTSHYYVAKQAAEFLDKPLNSLNLITLHLGNGGSVSAIKQGESIDTSMGMTPLEGLIMGTRSGDIDPAIPFYLNQNKDMSSEDVNDLLNKQSGLKGICGENDMRAIHAMADDGDKKAKLALEMYCYRIKKYIGAYYAVLGRIDALVFTGGIGENDCRIRERICTGLDILGISIDLNKNVRHGKQVVNIKNSQSALDILVIPTNEELEIAMQSMRYVKTD